MPNDSLRAWTDQARQLNAGLADTTEELNNLEVKLDLTHRLVRTQRIMQGILVVMMILLVVLAISNRALFDQINSCTNSNGKCAKANSAKTAQLVQQIIDENRKDHDEIKDQLNKAHPGTAASTTTTTTTTTPSAKKQPTGSSQSPATTTTSTTSAPKSSPQSTTSTTQRCVSPTTLGIPCLAH